MPQRKTHDLEQLGTLKQGGPEIDAYTLPSSIGRREVGNTMFTEEPTECGAAALESDPAIGRATTPCWFFAKGKCKRGTGCQFQHCKPTVAIKILKGNEPEHNSIGTTTRVQALASAPECNYVFCAATSLTISRWQNDEAAGEQIQKHSPKEVSESEVYGSIEDIKESNGIFIEQMLAIDIPKLERLEDLCM